jgi:putative membrane protein
MTWRWLLPHDRFQRVLFVLFLAFFAASCVAPPYLEYLLMQHVPTVLGAFLLAYLSNRFVISRLSFASIILFGVSVSQTFGFERNHYDRLVHFSFGLLLAVPIREVERRYLGLSVAVASVLAVECIVATSASYELIEWFVAVIFTPDWADQFLGQQGDMFDAQKDMSLAASGAIVSICILAVVNRTRNVA